MTRLFLLALAIPFVLMGCDSTDDTGQARVRLLMTDSPLDDFASAFVTVTRVELLGDFGASGTTSTDMDDVFVLTDTPFRVDLLTLQDGVTAMLSDTLLPAGVYRELRFLVDDTADIVFKDSTTTRLKVPSGSQTGIKVTNLPNLVLNDGEEVQLLVDFDIEDSFVKAGNSGKYLFKPVLRLEDVTGLDD